MILRFHFEGNTPSKKNQKRIGINPKTQKRMIFSSKEHKKWHGPAVLSMKLQMAKTPGVRFPIPRCVQVIALLYYEDRRRRDSSNTFESIMDLLVDAGILEDDSWAITGPTGQFPQLRKDRPGWEVQLHLADPAPGLAEVHNYVMPSKAPEAQESTR